jgi:hypothetical protein
MSGVLLARQVEMLRVVDETFDLVPKNVKHDYANEGCSEE